MKITGIIIGIIYGKPTLPQKPTPPQHYGMKVGYFISFALYWHLFEEKIIPSL